MDMITCSADTHHSATCCVYKVPYIRMYTLQLGIPYRRTRCLDMEYQMNVYFT